MTFVDDGKKEGENSMKEYQREVVNEGLKMCEEKVPAILSRFHKDHVCLYLCPISGLTLSSHILNHLSRWLETEYKTTIPKTHLTTQEL